MVVLFENFDYCLFSRVVGGLEGEGVVWYRRTEEGGQLISHGVHRLIQDTR